MSAVIVIEIVVGIVILAAAVRFAVRDARQRSISRPEQGSEAPDTADAPAGGSKVQSEQHLSEVGSSAETS
jgi:hypothetical protein